MLTIQPGVKLSSPTHKESISKNMAVEIVKGKTQDCRWSHLPNTTLETRFKILKVKQINPQNQF